MNKNYKVKDFAAYILGLLMLTVAVAACNQETGYDQYKALSAKELASGKRVDTLFFGVRLGMSSKEFYTHCWEMNQRGLFTDGENNTAVLYKLNNGELKDGASMNFYPDFYEDKIHHMKANFEYDGWAPWNKHLSADSLQNDVLSLCKKWYKSGNPFIKLEDEKKGTIYVKVDGNRRIIIGKFDDRRVKVDYTDLEVEKKLEVYNAKK